MTLPTPHPSPLPQGERGSNRSLRGWRAKPRRGRSPRVLNGEAMPFTRGTAFARQCRYPPLTLALSRKGEGIKPKSPRLAGEIPSRTESSCPARRSRAIEAWGGIRQAMPLPTPHPDPLPQGERGSNRSLRGWRAKPRRGRSPRVLNGEAVPLRRGAAFARQCRYPPLTLTFSRKGGGDQTEVSEAGARNPVEGRALVSCTAKPCHGGVGRHSPGNDVTDPSP